MIMQTTIIIQPIQRVTEIQIVETVIETVPPNATRPSASFHSSGTGVFLGIGTALTGTGTGRGSYGTAVSVMPAPYNDTEPWTKKVR
jgi:hypothetical protein